MRKEKEFSRMQRHVMSVDDFELLTIVGRGAFGEVRIVREKSTGKLLAMKKLKKAETVKKNQARLLRSLLRCSDSKLPPGFSGALKGIVS